MRRALVAGLFALTCALTALADDRSVVAGAVVNSVAWEKRWYGEFVGESCVTKQSAIRVDVELPASGPSTATHCSSGARLDGKTTGFRAYVEGAQLFLMGRLESPARAEIVDGEQSPICSLTEDDLQRRAAQIRRAGIAVSFPKAEFDKHVEEVAPSAELQAFVARSVKSWLRTKGKRVPAEITIGKVAKGDPFVIVSWSGALGWHLIAMPTAAQLNNEAICGSVYSGARFSGRSGGDRKQRTELVRRLEQHSISMDLK